MRADARRNYDLLLAAATEVFAEHGAQAPLDEVARRAGVGNATMYRHFPTRQELLLAVYADEVRGLLADGARWLASGEPAGDALFGWLEAFVAHAGSKRFLAAAVTGPDSLFDRWHRDMRDTAAALLRRAQDAGAVKPGTDAWDLLVLANGIALAATDGEQVRRLLAMVRDGVA
ncbi:TetR/AcrR family transcriptional regulator [Dactylosporangium sp. NPDC051541]|uniref:TetR/AcrR family transcriptional regulator n=1 Tax=Dactylosporangium sp. NPDC051541 TaxID=3363977 RepID=UPI0037A5D4D3